MINETKQQVKENETTVNRWKEERLSRILNRSVRLPESAATDFYKIVDDIYRCLFRRRIARKG
jgi:hypothetical protein